MHREYIENSNILTLDIKALYSTNKVQSHRTITDEARFKELLLAIDNYESSIFTKVAFQIIPYLFLRSTNIRNLEWKEVDFEKKQIIIRANKVKAREDFIVPLSQSVLDLLLYVKNFSYSDSKYVFPSDISKSKTISEHIKSSH